jgi:hypothetical protein
MQHVQRTGTTPQPQDKYELSWSGNDPPHFVHVVHADAPLSRPNTLTIPTVPHDDDKSTTPVVRSSGGTAGGDREVEPHEAELTPSPPDTPIPGPSCQPEVTYRDVAMMRTGGHHPHQGPTTMMMTSPRHTPSSWSTSTTPQSHSQSLSDMRLDLSTSPPTAVLSSPQPTTQQQPQQSASPSLPLPITTPSPIVMPSITMTSALTLPPSLLMVVMLINNQGRVVTMGTCYVLSTARLQLSSKGVVHVTW